MNAAVRSELRTGAVVTASVAAAGIPVAVVWWLIAPLPQLVVRAGSIYYTEANTEYAVAADGWFAVCTATAGLVAALVVFARARHARLGPLVGLAAGGLLGAVVAWRLGVHLGPGGARDTAKGLADGTRFDGPLQLGARGVLFAWPLASVVAYFALTAGLEPPELPDADVEHVTGPPFPVTVLRPGYAIAEVDDLFRRLDAGELSPAAPGAVCFSATRLRRGYDEASVDAALEARAARAADLTPRDPAAPGGSVPPSPR
ncbi:MAG: hypothetical protein ACXV2J_05565 [Actinomycetes bacterium]